MNLSHDDYDRMYGASDGPGRVGQWIQRHPTEVGIFVVLSVVFALFAGHAAGKASERAACVDSRGTPNE